MTGSVVLAEQKAVKPAASTVTTPLCTAEGPGFFDLKAKGIDGKEVDLSVYRGKVVMVVNTASRCGYTGQYKELQQLQAQYEKQGFTVLGFPSNDFAAQEPGTNEQIKSFCELNYKVTFPLFSKAPVTGEGKQPVYRFLTAGRPEVGWNFEKFLIDRKGQIAGRFLSKIEPKSKEVIAALESALAQKTETCR
ncbi:MAG: glutathione peroxidase [Bdellovibrionaceae bacterium]|nr:glutathione peroxidase [Pseudobdellovibrionaceae bacterium]